MFEKVKNNFRSRHPFLNTLYRDDLWMELVSGATGTFGLKIVFTGLGFIYTFLLARILEPPDYGIFVYVKSWIQLLSVFSIFGCSALIVREISALKIKSSLSLIRGLILWASRNVLLFSVIFAVFVAIIISTIINNFSSEITYTFWIGLVLLPLLSLIRLKKAIMQGLHLIVKGQLPEMFLQPILFILLICVTYFILRNNFSAAWAMALNVFATGISFIIATIQLKKYLPEGIEKVFPEFKKRFWLTSAFTLILVDGIFVVNNRADILILGALKGSYSTGVYAISLRVIELITFIHIAVNYALAPTISRLYSTGDILKLQNIITKSARIAFFFSFLIVIFFLIFGHWLLLIFGFDYTQGKSALIILSIGRLICVFQGPVALILVMTGYEKIVSLGVGFGTFINIILNFMLIPKWGMEGAAVATSCSMLVWNILLVIWAYNKIGIHSTVLGKIKFLGK